MSESQICPWCMTEIVWDEEIGPEEACPHCLNELGDYRTVEVSADELEEESRETSDPLEGGRKGNVIPFDREELPAADEEEFDWDTVQVKNRDSLQYEQSVERALEHQDEVPECPNCREYMIHAGDTQVTEDRYIPAMPKGLNRTLLKAPFSMRMYICPFCFHVSLSLDGEGRTNFIDSLEKS